MIKILEQDEISHKNPPTLEGPVIIILLLYGDVIYKMYIKDVDLQ